MHLLFFSCIHDFGYNQLCRFSRRYFVNTNVKMTHAVSRYDYIEDDSNNVFYKSSHIQLSRCTSSHFITAPALSIRSRSRRLAAARLLRRIQGCFAALALRHARQGIQRTHKHHLNWVGLLHAVTRVIARRIFFIALNVRRLRCEGHHRS